MALRFHESSPESREPEILFERNGPAPLTEADGSLMSLESALFQKSKRKTAEV